jgi:L-2-hydroxyglutarate oxidase LhgO
VTGIIDSHALMLAYLGDLENAGGALAVRSPFEGAVARDDGFVVRVGGAAPTELASGVLVNAAGLDAPALARRIDGLDARHVPRTWFAKGNYYALAGRSPFTRLIYPVPSRAASASTSRSTSPARRASAPTSNGSTSARPTRSTTPSTRRAARSSTPRSGATGRRSPTARWRRRTAACARSCRGRASRRATSCCRAPRRTASPG